MVLNWQESSRVSIYAGVPQGSISGPMLFLIFINAIVDEVNCNIKLFADDTNLYPTVDSPLLASICLNSDMQIIHRWAERWMVTFNPKKTKSMIVSRKLDPDHHPWLHMAGNVIKIVDSHKHLGLTYFNSGTWNTHLNDICTKASVRLNLLRRLKFTVDRRSLETMYFSYIRPILEYTDVIWDNCSEYMKDRLEHINYEAACIVTGATKLTSLNTLLHETGWETLRDRRTIHKLILFQDGQR